MTVYFAQGSDSGLVKIGYSRHTWKRIEQLSSGVSDKMTLLRVCPGGRVAEQWVHRRFSEQRCHGEWFKFCPEMMSVSVPPEFLCDDDAEKSCSPIKYEINVDKSLAAAIKENYAHLRGATNKAASDANVLPRAAKNWLAETNLPGAVPLIHMMAANEQFRDSIAAIIDEVSEQLQAEELKK